MSEGQLRIEYFYTNEEGTDILLDGKIRLYAGDDPNSPIARLAAILHELHALWRHNPRGPVYFKSALIGPIKAFPQPQKSSKQD